MEEQRREDRRSEEVDSSTLDNSEGAAPVRKLERFSWCVRVFRQLMVISLSLSPSSSTGSRSQKWGSRVLLLSVAEGPLCRATPGTQLPRRPARQRADQTEPGKPAAAAGWAEGAEGAVRPDEESAQVGRPHCSTRASPLRPLLSQFTRCFRLSSRSAKRSSCWWTNSTRRKGFAWLCRCVRQQSVLLVCYCVASPLTQQLI